MIVLGSAHRYGTNREMCGGARQVDQHWGSAGVSGSIGVYRKQAKGARWGETSRSALGVAQEYRYLSERIGTNREMRGRVRQVDQQWSSAWVSRSIGVYRN